jgi:hypothetical protein
VRKFVVKCLTAVIFLLAVLVLQRGEEKCLGVEPVSVSSCSAYPERFCRFLVAQATEVTQLDQFRLDWRFARERFQRTMNMEDFIGSRIDDIESLLQAQTRATAAAPWA